jgi:hypothetical protein
MGVVALGGNLGKRRCGEAIVNNRLMNVNGFATGNKSLQSHSRKSLLIRITRRYDGQAFSAPITPLINIATSSAVSKAAE